MQLTHSSHHAASFVAYKTRCVVLTIIADYSAHSINRLLVVTGTANVYWGVGNEWSHIVRSPPVLHIRL